MNNADLKTIFLKDYQAPDVTIESVRLVFDIHDGATEVSNTMHIRHQQHNDLIPLEMYGEDLTLLEVLINNEALSQNDYQLTADKLTILRLPHDCELTVKTKIQPETNTQLSGLYKSKSMYCTQCEAEGFRRITFYLDRPDVLSVFTTKIIADKSQYPILLSNGNPVNQGTLDNGRHWVEWHDPFKKPSYLFALVAGDLACVEDTFTTCSGRTIPCRIYVEHGNEDKCDHAMLSLKKSMRWDEDVFGREYDLDIFMIVAVSAFNMGAMENKGLNIFNSQYILAKPETATDLDYQNIQAVVAHEYFHNWSGNRITCRDWFQLSLKEGLTVFREQEFSRDMNSRDVMRIKDVQTLRAAQFPEDAGPMAHPVRPESYVEINNFYTPTVYEKGAEVIRMLHTLLGPEQFRKGMDEYFQRFDGQAVTTDDFVKAHEIASNRDLSHFKLWYRQAGTPVITVEENYNPERKQFTLTLKQHTANTPGQTDKQPLHIPIAIGLINQNGQPMSVQFPGTKNLQSHGVLELTTASQSFCFEQVDSAPYVSFLRDFSAPVHVKYPRDDQALCFLLQHDDNGFARWEAGQELLTRTIFSAVADLQNGQTPKVSDDVVAAFQQLITDNTLDLALKAALFALPAINYLAELMTVIDIDALHDARKFVKKSLGTALYQPWVDEFQRWQSFDVYRNDQAEIARRSWKNTCLDYLMSADPTSAMASCLEQFNLTNNMTDSMAALGLIVDQSGTERDQALTHFYQRWQHEELVVNKWFSLQARSDRSDVINQVRTLLAHESFEMKNPNKVRALIGGFCVGNPVHFHQADGAGYTFLADHVIELDNLNPQVAARLSTAFTRWRKFDDHRQSLMRAELQRIQQQPSISKDVSEIVAKSLAD